MGKALDAWLLAESGLDIAALDADPDLIAWDDAKQVKGKGHRESSLEAAAVAYAVSRGWMHKKIGTNAWPDHMFLAPLTDHEQPLGVLFVEFKQRGKAPRPNQAKRLGELRGRGFTAVVCDRKEQFVELFGP